MADPTPNSVRALLNSFQWTNGQKKIAGQNEYDVLSAILDLFDQTYARMTDAERRLRYHDKKLRYAVVWVNGAKGPYINLRPESIAGLGGSQLINNPSLNIDLTQGSVPGGVAIGGGINGSRTDNTGNRVQNSGPRFDYSNVSPFNSLGVLLEPARTNSCRNSVLAGSAAGTPGTPPTNVAYSLNGLSAQVIGSGTLNGSPYVDIRFFGTPTSGSFNVFFETATAIAALNGQKWAFGLGVAMVGGSQTNVTSQRLIVNECTTAGAVVGSPNIGTSTLATPTSTLTRYTNIFTLANGATVGNMRPYFRPSVALGQPVDITYRFSLPQPELIGANEVAGATTPIFTSGAALTRSIDTMSLTMPNNGQSQLIFVFDDNTTQTISAAPGAFNVPVASLTRRRVKSVLLQLTQLNKYGY